MKIVNLTKNTMLAENAVVARTLASRLKGLLGRTHLAKGEGFIIPDCASIHTFFMQFSIDVIFLNQQRKVVKLKKCVPPYRLLDCPFKGSVIIELPAGTIEASSTAVSDLIDLQIK